MYAVVFFLFVDRKRIETMSDFSRLPGLHTACCLNLPPQNSDYISDYPIVMFVYVDHRDTCTAYSLFLYNDK